MPTRTATMASTPPAHGEDQRLDERLTDQPSARGAKRRADRHLALPHGTPGEQQVRQVHARHQQDEPDAAKQQPERGTHRADRLLVQRHDRGTDRTVRRGICRRELRRDAPHFGVGLLRRDAGLQPADHGQKPRCASASPRPSCGLRQSRTPAAATPRRRTIALKPLGPSMVL